MGSQPPRPAAPPLPVDRLLRDITAQLRGQANLVLEAPPGAGKTTRVPPALLGVVKGDVLVLEPRRLAARLAARRVAWELGERVGDTAGYQVRFEEVAGPRTRLRFLTEGVLTRRLISDPGLRGVGAVILDEFHERHLEGDLALALLRRLQRTARPDLRLVVMSATMDPRPVARFLGECAILRSEGRLFDLAISYTPVSADPLGEQVGRALDKLIRETPEGDILVFLPGAAEIHQAMRACAPLAERWGLVVLPLHGDLPAEEQDRAVAPADRRKVILSTNVAESSVTIDGVKAVIDSGLSRVAGYSAWSGLPVLRLKRVSRASAEQRAGRAGRTAPGRVIRLYPAEDFHRRPAHETPDVLRRELTATCLDLHAMGLGRVDDLEWLDPPPAESIRAAEDLLARLGAVDRRGLTETGRRMAGYPLPPRLSRMVIEAETHGTMEDGCAIAALLSAGARAPEQLASTGPSDLFALLESDWPADARRIHEQIRRASPGRKRRGRNDTGLLLSVLAAFPDRVAKRRDGQEFLLASGGAVRLSPASVVRGAEWIVAVDVEERPERGLPVVRAASAVDPEWLIDLFPERITERNTVQWDRRGERVEAVSALVYEDLVIQEGRGGQPDPDIAAGMLADKAIEAGVGRFADVDEVESFLARAAFAGQYSSMPSLGDADVREALAALCRGLRSFAELEAKTRDGGLLRALASRMPAAAKGALDATAPEKIHLPSGRRVRVHYSRTQAPWAASRLQDFFGMTETPRLAGGKVAVVLHLLAPNQRPVQTTTDLAGFWERWYPKVRRELSRRYPRHPWPEKPA